MAAAAGGLVPVAAAGGLAPVAGERRRATGAASAWCRRAAGPGRSRRAAAVVGLAGHGAHGGSGSAGGRKEKEATPTTCDNPAALTIPSSNANT